MMKQFVLYAEKLQIVSVINTDATSVVAILFLVLVAMIYVAAAMK